MYLTTHRVSSPAGKEGINAFLYRHGEVEASLPRIDWSHPDLPRIVEECPGTLSSSAIEVPAGGNRVRSFLDIVAPDSTGAARIESALDQFEGALTLERLGMAYHFSEVAVRFNVEADLSGQALQQFQQLRASALHLIRNPANLSWETASPLTVLVTEDEAGTRTYSLDEPSIVRLRALHGTTLKPCTLSASQEVRSDLTCLVGNTYGNLAAVLADVPLVALRYLGGARFINSASGEECWSWSSGAGTGYCLNCQQQGTLVSASPGASYRCSFCGNLQTTDGLWVATL